MLRSNGAWTLRLLLPALCANTDPDQSGEPDEGREYGDDAEPTAPRGTSELVQYTLSVPHRMLSSIGTASSVDMESTWMVHVTPAVVHAASKAKASARSIPCKPGIEPCHLAPATLRVNECYEIWVTELYFFAQRRNLLRT